MTVNTPIIKKATPAIKTPMHTPTQVQATIDDAKATVIVTGKERARALRTAAETAALTTYGPFTIESKVTRTEEEGKFQAWISGARGYNGYIIEGKMGRAVVGLTTLLSFLAIDPKSVTNADAFKIQEGKAGTATMKGIL